MRSTIICVDDDKFLLSTLAEQLQEWLGQNYAIEKAVGGHEALEILDDCAASDTPVSVVISDYIMPAMRGDELLCKIHERDKSIRKIMLTGYTQIEGIINTINNAALYRFISKPWDKKDMMLTVVQALKSYEQEKNNLHLLQSFEKLHRGHELQLGYLLKTVAGAIDTRCDSRTGHSQNVSIISCEIAKKFELSADAVKNLRTMAFFHNIGRIILSDDDLSPIRGNEQTIYNYPSFIALQNEAAKRIFSMNPQFDSELLKGICFHLEKFDGTGLRKLKGDDIPIEARIIGIANYYDLLVSGGAPRAAALERLNSMKGTFFDPHLMDIFSGLNL